MSMGLYHSFLRVAVSVVALLLVFDSGLLVTKTSDLSDSTQDYLASAVGVRAAVAPNELNVLTARITELENELKVKDREIAVNLNKGSEGGFDGSTFVLSIILFILLILIVMNYILDYLRNRPVISKAEISMSR